MAKNWLSQLERSLICLRCSRALAGGLLERIGGTFPSAKKLVIFSFLMMMSLCNPLLYADQDHFLEEEEAITGDMRQIGAQLDGWEKRFIEYQLMSTWRRHGYKGSTHPVDRRYQQLEFLEYRAKLLHAMATDYLEASQQVQLAMHNLAAIQERPLLRRKEWKGLVEGNRYLIQTGVARIDRKPKEASILMLILAQLDRNRDLQEELLLDTRMLGRQLLIVRGRLTMYRRVLMRRLLEAQKTVSMKNW